MAFKPGVDNTDEQRAFVYSMYSPSTVKSELVGFVPFPTPKVVDGIIQNTFAELSYISNYSTDISRFDGLSIGDKLPITVDGVCGSSELNNYECYAEIIDFDHNAEVEGYGITFQLAFFNNHRCAFVGNTYGQQNITGDKIFNFNHWGGVAYGGWKASDIRYDVLGSTDVAPEGYGSAKNLSSVGYDATSTCATDPVPNTLMSCLPENLRRVMKPIIKWTDNTVNPNIGRIVSSSIDYLPLLSQYEVFGTTTSANPAEEEHQVQYSGFYISSSSRTKYKLSNKSTDISSSAVYRLRSAYLNSVAYVTGVNGSGDTLDVCSIVYSYGIAPIFLI